MFFEELAHLLEHLSSLSVQLVLMGYIHIRLDRSDDPHTLRFNNTLASFSLIQHIQEPTHNLGEMLDIVITKTDSPSANVSVNDVSLSDHCLVQWTLDLETTPLEYETFISTVVASRQSWV